MWNLLFSQGTLRGLQPATNPENTGYPFGNQIFHMIKAWRGIAADTCASLGAAERARAARAEGAAAALKGAAG